MEYRYTNRLFRLIQLITEIKTNPRQRPESLYQALGVSKAMFFKDKRAMADLGFEFIYSRKDGEYKITGDGFLPALNLTTSELISLIMAVRQLSSTGDYILTDNALKAIKKIIANTSGEIREFFLATFEDVVLKKGFGCDAKILDDLWRAAQERQRIVITHTQASDGVTRDRLIDPYQIFFKRRALYLDAYDVEEKKVLMFRVNRISRVRFTGVRLENPVVEYNFRARHLHSFSVFAGEDPKLVRIKFDRRTARFIREVCWHSSQRIEELSDGSIIFEVSVSEPKEVAWWALQWGAGAQILDPPDLRSYMAGTIEDMLKIYK